MNTASNIEEINKDQEENLFKEVVDKALTHMYEFYMTDHSMKVCVWVRTSEPWHDDPGELLTKEQFVDTINGGEYETALNVLIAYIFAQGGYKPL